MVLSWFVQIHYKSFTVILCFRSSWAPGVQSSKVWVQLGKWQYYTPPPQKKGRHLSPCKFVMVILLTGSFACVFFYIYFDLINLIYNNESRRLIISMNFYVVYWVYNTMNTHSANRENVIHFGYYKSTALIKWGIYIYIAYSTNDLHYG